MVSIYNPKYYDRVALSIPGYKKVIDEVIKIVDKKSYYTILDVGCGTGRVALKLVDKVFKAEVNVKSAWKVKKLANRLHWDVIKKTENRYPICFILKRIIAYLFFEHPLSEKKWLSLLNEIGFDGIKTENFDNFILVWCRR